MGILASDSAFRQRKYYWRKKGLSEEAAIEKAMNSRRTQTGTKIHLLPQPSPSAIDLKEVPKKENPERGVCHFGSPPILIFASFVITCSYLLVSFTAEALGGSSQAWLVALLLEIGALTLSVVKPHGITKLLFCRLTSGSIVLLTLFLLHGAGQTSHDQSSRQEESLQRQLTILEDQRRAIIVALESLPVTHLTKREAYLQKVDVLNGNIGAILTELTASQSLTTIKSRTLTDFALRVVLIVMNLIFGSLFVEALRKKNSGDPVQASSIKFQNAKVRLSLLMMASAATLYFILNPQSLLTGTSIESYIGLVMGWIRGGGV